MSSPFLPRWLWLLLIWLAVTPVWAASAPDAAPALTAHDWQRRTDCLRCHAMATLGYREEATGRVVSLAIPAAEFLSSDHGRLPCQKCHEGDSYQEYPHDSAAPSPRTCLQCHGQDPAFKKYRLEAIAAQVGKGVHRGSDGKAATCVYCHDNHRVRLSNGRQEEGEKRIVHANAACRACHEEPNRRTNNGLGSSLAARHGWLPNVALHWESVRCVDCHTPPLGAEVHSVEPAKRAQQRCEECHTKDSLLLTKLYRHRLVEERQRAGFLNSMVLNDAYIIGMTRNEPLDLLSMLLLGGTLAGVTAHAGLRLWFARRREHPHG